MLAWPFRRGSKSNSSRRDLHHGTCTKELAPRGNISVSARVLLHEQEVARRVHMMSKTSRLALATATGLVCLFINDNWSSTRQSNLVTQVDARVGRPLTPGSV